MSELLSLRCPHCQRPLYAALEIYKPPPPLALQAVSAELLARSVGELEFSLRTSNVLKDHSLATIGDLVRLSQGELLRMHDMGRKSVNEIEQALAPLGLHLGMELE